MAKQTDNAIVIKDWPGIAGSPLLGFGELRNLDLDTYPGLARVGLNTTKRSGSVVTDLPIWAAVDPNNALYCWMLGDTGRLYFSSDGGLTWVLVSGNGSGAGQGLGIWKNYLFVIGATAVDVWGPLTTAIPFSAARTFIVSSVGDDTFQGSGDQTILQTTGTPVRVSSDGTLPAGLVANTTYWTRTAGSSLFRLYPTLADAQANTNQIDVTDSGSGIHSIVVYGWTLSWQTITSDTKYHPCIATNDDQFHIGAGRYIAKLRELDGQTFAPGSSGTYEFSGTYLDLPAGVRVKCLEELGDLLMIGTWRGSNIYDFESADIYPWDKAAPYFEKPVRLNDNGVHAMCVENNLLYAIVGTKGRMIRTNGFSAEDVLEIPGTMMNLNGGKYLVVHPGGMKSRRGKIYIGIGGVTGVSGCGVFTYHVKKNRLAVENTISTGGDGSTTTVTIGAVAFVLAADRYMFGWKEDSTYGIDLLDATSRYGSYKAFITSPLYRVGTQLAPVTFSEISMLLGNPLPSGCSVRIKYRKNLNDSYTTIKEWTYAAIGGVTSVRDGAAITDAIDLQILIELTASSANTPDLREVRIE